VTTAEHAPATVAVLVSGGGTNLAALLDALHGRPGAPARVARVVASRADAVALERARHAGVATAVLADPADPGALLAALEDADLAVLAGYVRRVPAPVVTRYRYRMINIHPALLPAFGGPGMYGRRVHEQVLASGVTLSGATVHYVDEEYDHGPIIAQWPVPVWPGDSPEALAARVLAVEHRLLPFVVTALAERGVPREPVRLFPTGSAFVTADSLEIDCG
jgi:phosphoribosylglycinamide formyltransferase 1